MRIASLKWRFTPALVRKTPDMQGVFSLWDGDECVYVGHTPGNASLRDCLREHLELVQRRLIGASHFMWETTATPKTREEELLGLMAVRQGSVPRYNCPGSPLRAKRASITDLRART